MFLNPAILAFLGVALVPAILHFLSRSRQESRVWAAMMFLPGGAQRRGAAPRNLTAPLLLALRSAAVALAVISLARPIWTSPLLPVSSPLRRASLVLILDTSGSTAASPVPGVTRLDAIKEAGARILASLPQDDVATILTCDAPPGPFTSDRQSLQSRLADLRSGERSLDVGQLILRASDLLRERPQGRRVIAVVTDRQAASYAGVDDDFIGGWEGRRKLAGIDRLLISAVGDAHRENVAIESISLPVGPVIRGKPAEVVVRLHNYGALPRVGFPIRVATTGVAEARATADLPARGEAEVSVALAFPAAGRVAVVAECAANAGPDFDDRLWAVVDVGDGIRVLAMNSAAGPAARLATGPTTGPAGLAIAPFGDRVADGAVVVPAPAGRLPTYSLSDYDLVVIPELTRLSEADSRALVEYVYAGGGLLAGVGPQTSGDALEALGAMLPATIAVRAHGGSARAVATDAFRYEGALPLGTVPAFRPLVPALAATRLVVAGDDAMLVEGRFGGGQVILSAIPLEGASSPMPRSEAFVPFVRAIVRRFAAGEARPLNSGLLAPVEVALRDAVEPRSVTLLGPDGRKAGVSIDHRAGRWVARCEGLGQPGLWRLRYRAGNTERVEPIAVRPSPAESELAADDSRVREVVERLGAESLDTRQALPLPELRPGLELWPHAMALAAICLGIEQMISARRARMSRQLNRAGRVAGGEAVHA